MGRVNAFDPSLLRRRPDIEAPELVAVDAADRLLLDTAADRPGEAGRVVTVNDAYGALTLGAVDLAAQGGPDDRVRAFQDGLVHERALALNAAAQGLQGAFRSLPLGDELLAGATTVLLRLPRSLDELDEIARMIARSADPAVRVLAGGRVKHMSPTMNEVLGRSFESVRAGLGRQKSRILVAEGPRPSADSPYPRHAVHDVGLDRLLQLRAFGATFGGASLDPGTRMLLPHLRELHTGTNGPDEVVDLGCGNGAIAAYLALVHPALRVHATDQSASAVRSTTATAEANGVADRVRTSRDDALSAVPDASVRVIVLNPPFHLGSTVHTGIGTKLFEACARVLVPGGTLWTVWNGHLRYRSLLERVIGPTRQLERSPRFTVTCSTRS